MIDVPALQPVNPLGAIAQAQQLRAGQQEMAMRNQAMQSQQLQMQQQQMALDQTQAINKSYQDALKVDPQTGTPSIDTEALQKSLAASGHGAAIPQILEGITKYQTGQADLKTKIADLQNKQADMLGGAAAAIKAANYDPKLAHTILDTMPPSPQINAMRQLVDTNPQGFAQMVDSAVSTSPAQQKFQNEQTVAKIRANTPEMQAMQSWMASNPGKSPADYQVYKKDLEVQAAVAKETNPAVLNARAALADREARMKQMLSQGDPNAAGQLLVNGDATLSELKSRGATPDFIAKALFAAHKLSNGAYNAQQAEAQFDVAKSPANTAFFGSAKSLTDKGGTLDQLAEVGKKLPQSQFPVLNSIADWEKAATGNGPIAEYAAKALGVADDYAKVMGGGVGSDSSRLSALNIIKANASPEARAGALNGIRGSVNSQVESRIGKNPIMRRMYGDVAQPQAGGGQQFSHVSASGKYGWDGTKWVPIQGAK